MYIYLHLCIGNGVLHTNCALYRNLHYSYIHNFLICLVIFLPMQLPCHSLLWACLLFIGFNLFRLLWLVLFMSLRDLYYTLHDILDMSLCDDYYSLLLRDSKCLMSLRDTHIAFNGWNINLCVLIHVYDSMLTLTPFYYIVPLWFLNTTYIQSNKNHVVLLAGTSYRNTVQGLKWSTWWRPQN